MKRTGHYKKMKHATEEAAKTLTEIIEGYFKSSDLPAGASQHLGKEFERFIKYNNTKSSPQASHTKNNSYTTAVVEELKEMLMDAIGPGSDIDDKTIRQVYMNLNKKKT